MSWTVCRQPHFKQQPKDQIVVWVYGLFTDKPGDYVGKRMRDCTGEEITSEWLGQKLHLPGPDVLSERLIGKLEETEIGELLAEYGLLP